MNKLIIAFALVGAAIFVSKPSGAQMMPMHDGMHDGMHMGQGASGPDERVKLDAPPMMKTHLKQNMREHLKAVNETLREMGKGDYKAASKILREKLGLTEQMKKMCGMMGNDTYRQMGIAFHESADKAAGVVAGGDAIKSAAAISSVLEKCVTCHEAFRVE
ncbi:MAG: cytochrome C [Nitrospinae bacterium]|nr:cytochrome C [Nitrospinota bacterium]